MPPLMSLPVTCPIWDKSHTRLYVHTGGFERAA